VGRGRGHLVAGTKHDARIRWRPGGMAAGLAGAQPRKAARRAPSGSTPRRRATAFWLSRGYVAGCGELAT
jgi:hypothetical protein